MRFQWLGAILVSPLGLQSTAAAQVSSAAAPSQGAAIWNARDARLIVGAERLFGLHVYRATEEPDQGGETEFSGTMLSAFYGQSAINDKNDAVNPYAIPRLGADAVLGGFTIGGNLGFGMSSGKERSAGSEQALVDVASFALYARFGYLIAPSASLAIWIRGGPEYFSTSHDDTYLGRKKTSYGFAFTLDPQLVLTPVPHAAILVGPLLDLGIWGKSQTLTDSSSFAARTRNNDFGATAGLALFF